MIESLYIHIPFCDSICSYCSFKKQIYNEEQSKKYILNLLDDLKRIPKCSLKTIYIGGGTPSSLADNDLEILLSNLKPLLKENASIYVFSDWATSMALAPILEKNFTIQNRITWQREKGRGSLKNWKNGMEDIWFLTANPSDYTFNVDQVKQRRQVVAPYRQDGVAKDWQATKNGNFRDTMPSNFWDDISIPYWSMPENTGHPTQKPEKLLAKIILASSNPNDFIFDPFAGSGSSLVTAAKLNRRYLGIEQSLLYCAWGQYRLNQIKDDPSIQGYTDGVFWERNTLAVQRKVKRQQRASEK